MGLCVVSSCVSWIWAFGLGSGCRVYAIRSCLGVLQRLWFMIYGSGFGVMVGSLGLQVALWFGVLSFGFKIQG